jgi:hypothetical protein
MWWTPFTRYGKFAFAPVEIPFKQRVTHHHYLARIFTIGFRNFVTNALGMVNAHDNFGGDTIQIGNHRSNQMPSPGMVNSGPSLER